MNELRATCPECKIKKCMRNTGDGEWVCESRKSKFCGRVYPEGIVSRNQVEEH